MSPDDIRDRVARIEALVHDNEAAHAAEDDLYADVLAAIASGAPNAAEIARQALRARALSFSRWCA